MTANVNAKRAYEDQTEINIKDKVFDIQQAMILRTNAKNGVYELAKMVLHMVCYTDTFPIGDGNSICVLLGTFCELGVESKTKQSNVFPLQYWVCNYPVDQSIYKPVVDLFHSLFFDKNLIQLHFDEINEHGTRISKNFDLSVKIIMIGLNKDKGLEIYNMKL